MNMYPKVYSLGHKAVQDVLSSGMVAIQEKIDGSQFSFGVDEKGDLHFRSKSAMIYDGDVPDVFVPAVEHVKRIREVLVPNWVYRAETLQSPRHNVLQYERIPTNHLMLFDIEIGLQEYMTAYLLSFIAEPLKIEAVPVFYYGSVEGVKDNFKEKMEEWLQRDSILGKEKVEGITIKNYDRFGADGSVLMAKVVTEEYKEVHREHYKIPLHPGKGDIVERLVQVLRTEARWTKAVQHLAEQGLLLNEPKDIGMLIAEVKRDIQEEEGEWIQAQIFKELIGNVLRGSTKGFAEWYKGKLAQEMIDNVQAVR